MSDNTESNRTILPPMEGKEPFQFGILPWTLSIIGYQSLIFNFESDNGIPDT
jgi:hypothetical protein